MKNEINDHEVLAVAEPKPDHSRLLIIGSTLTGLFLAASLNPYAINEASSQETVHEATLESDTGRTLYEKMEAVCLDGEAELHHTIQPSHFMYFYVMLAQEPNDRGYNSGDIGANIAVTSFNPWSYFRVGNRTVTLYNIGEFEDGSSVQGEPVSFEYPCDDPDPEPTPTPEPTPSETEPGTGGPEDPMTATSIAITDDPAQAAAEVSVSAFTDANTAIIGTTRDFPDALAAVPLAAQQDAPILLTDQSSLSAPTQAELSRLGVQNVIIVGGENAVSTPAVEQIEALGITTTRIQGAERTETAVNIANYMAEHAGSNGLEAADTYYVVNGENFPDALSAGVNAGRSGDNILLARNGDLPAATAAHIRDNNIQDIVVVGGESVVPSSIREDIAEAAGIATEDITVIAGPERVATSATAAQIDLDNQSTYLERVYVQRADQWFGAIATSAVVSQSFGFSMILGYNFEGAAPNGVTTSLEGFLTANKVKDANTNELITDQITFVGNFTGEAAAVYSTTASGVNARAVQR